MISHSTPLYRSPSRSYSSPSLPPSLLFPEGDQNSGHFLGTSVLNLFASVFCASNLLGCPREEKVGAQRCDTNGLKRHFVTEKTLCSREEGQVAGERNYFKWQFFSAIMFYLLDITPWNSEERVLRWDPNTKIFSYQIKEVARTWPQFSVWASNKGRAQTLNTWKQMFIFCANEGEA